MITESQQSFDLEEFIDQLRTISGFDFSGYARPSLQRRVLRYLDKFGIEKADLLHRLSEGNQAVHDFVQELTVHYSEMFRDPDVYVLFGTEVLTYLESYPFLRVWSAGCAGGEEAYSLAIFLKEAGLYDRSRVYATDLSERVVSRAKEGAYAVAKMRQFSENYIEAGGVSSLSDYYRVSNGRAVMVPELRQNMSFATHDLIGDGVFNEFNLIFCRNVLIYFTQSRRATVLKLLYDSLAVFGFLCLGKREGLKHTGLEDKFKIIDHRLNIYQKII